MGEKPRSAKPKAPAKKAPQKGKRSAVGARPVKARKPAPAKSDTKKKASPAKAPPAPPPSFPRESDIQWTDEFVEALAGRLWRYIEVTSYPTVAQFCLGERIHRQRLYDKPVLNYVREFLIAKKEDYLERALLTVCRDDGSLTTGLIFALKQLGWKDDPEAQGGDGEAIKKRRAMFDELFGAANAPV